MKIVFGLGNPGLKYKDTRHNIGFMVTDRLIENYKLSIKNTKLYQYASSGSLDKRFFIIQPMTYMNLAGEAICKFLSYYKFEISDLLVVCDDININLGEVRLRMKGGSGGHNGLSSVTTYLNSSDYPRLRIGIGNDFEKGYQADYVLSKFETKEKEILEKVLNYSTAVCDNFICDGYKAAADYISKNKIEL